MTYEQFQRLEQQNLEYGTRARKVLTVAKPLATVGIAVAGIVTLKKLIGKWANKSDKK